MTSPRPVRPRGPRPGRPRPRGGRPGGPGHRSQSDQALLLPRLFDLWAEYVGQPTPPPLDRWLARTLGDLDGLPREKRLWLGAALADGVRFAWLALLCAESSGKSPLGVVQHARRGLGDLGDAWRRLGRLEPRDLFFWVFLRLREAGANPPRLQEPIAGAVGDWHRIREDLARDGGTAARLLWVGLPDALAPEVDARAERCGWSDTERHLFIDRQILRPPLWLRLQDSGVLDDVLAELHHAGFRTEVLDDAIAATGDRGIFELECWRRGHVEIQDLASQAIGVMVAPEPGHFVWDACAGGGGKALQLAALMGGTGAVYATDPNAHALAELRKRAKRAGLTSVRAYPWDGQALPDFGKSVARRGGFDRVLVDAPCSGCGTWRRNPDGRLRARPDGLTGLTTVQSHLLDVTSAAVKPGGLLVYATCSWFVAEDEEQVDAFAARHPEFQVLGQALHGNPGDDADTTFTAVMRRRAEG
ncbi:MAG: RsmB/NOP family class I SAM-dependent RNA methyltransferase [Candidatus Krumholzibacteriia bacterium]